MSWSRRTRRPSLNSRVKLSPTIDASLPSREMMSPVDLTPVSFAASCVPAAGAPGVGGKSASPDLGDERTWPWRSCQPMSCLRTFV